MICEECGKQATRLRGISENGKITMRCNSCMSGKNTSLYPTDKRWYEGEGYSFYASPAHISDIQHRKVACDGRSVERRYR